MRITPLDIHQQQFKIRLFRGYDVQEVNVFLETVAQEMDETIQENGALKEDNRKLSDRLKFYQDREDSIKETLVALQKATEEIKRVSEREAHAALSEARLGAEKILREANELRAKIMSEVEGLRRQKAQLEASLKATLQAHIRLMDSWGSEPARETPSKPPEEPKP